MSRATDEAARELLGPLLEVAPRPGRFRVVGWDAEQGITVTLERGTTTLLVELEPRDESHDCYARTSLFNVSARRQFAADQDLDDLDRRAVDQLVALVASREGRLPLFERPTTTRRSVVREIEVDRVLMPEGHGHYYVDPYVGCMIGCEFCYVGPRADLSRKLEGLPELAWGRWVDVKSNAHEVLAREVREHPPGVVRMSPLVTDPYQPLESRYRVTRRCLEVLVGTGFSPVILTRGARVLDDLELLRRFETAAVGFSIPTDDDAMRVFFEPGADPVDERFDALERCARAGLATFVVVQPVLPMNAARFVERVSPFVRAVRIDRMHDLSRSRHLYEAAGIAWAAEDAFFERTIGELRRGFAARGVRFDELDDMSTVLGLTSRAGAS